ncbi:MAG: hypothetical protein JXQ87_10155 [Bacteroidia bacterium]
MKKSIAIVFALFVASAAFSQYRDFDNFEIQVGFKGFRVTPGSFSFRHDTLYPDTAFVQGRHAIGSPNNMNLLSIGYEAQVYDNIFVSVKSDFNIGSNNRKRIPGLGIQLGAGYRYNLNYFMRLQGEFLLNWGMLTDTLGFTSSYSPERLTLKGIQFQPNTQLTAFYRGQQYGFQPKISLVANMTPLLEFRFTMMYQVALVYNQAIEIEGEIGPDQTEKVILPFRSEYTQVMFDDLPPEKAIYRPSGFSARVGFAYKLPVN